MHRFTFACLTLMSCALLSASGCGGGVTSTSTTGGDGGNGGAPGTGGSGGVGGTGGSACVPQTEQCDGADNNCDGMVDEGCQCIDGEQRDCYSGPMGSQGVGSCAGGKQSCGLSGVWDSVCLGEVVPQAEKCNSVDDDCNGTADDMGMVSCGVGACAATVLACDNGAPGTCVTGMPTVEICDGIDNNCNQLIDESFPNQGAACDSGLPGACSSGKMKCMTENGTTAASCVPDVMPAAEACDGIDNDCNGTTDDDIPGTGGECATGALGPCALGTVSCQDNAIGCYPDVPASAETCDGVDNDCNGTVDDPPGANMACDTGLLGACKAGIQKCSGGAFSCVQQQQAQATDLCGDNQDNDCDGQVDEGCLYTFSGVANNLPVAQLFGWTQCYADGYGTSAPLSTVLTQCNKAKLLLGCRQTGSQSLVVAANAPRLDVIFDTGMGQTPHNANGVGWYYNSSYSWGFAPENSPINRNSCDIVDSQSYPGVTTDGAQRICWHTSGGNLSSGWRCGKADFLGAPYERVVFQAD